VITSVARARSVIVDRMRRLFGAASLTIILWAGTFADVARAQQGVTAGAHVVFYGDNTEFHNPFREGETLFGAAVRLDGELELNDRVALMLGVFGNQIFGSESAFDLVRPVLSLRIRGRRSTFVFGTLASPRVGDPPGPDRAGPHGLLPPLQRETLAFERPYEAGLQWMFTGARLQHDLWLQWQKLNTPEHRERLDAGGRLEWRARGPLSLPFQAHIVHEGGQLYASGPVRDSVAVASGITLSTRHRARSTWEEPIVSVDASLELLGLWSHHTPDREQPGRTRDGGAFFGRASVELNEWRAHLIMWRGDDYVKDEGDPNYLSVRRDGTRYRGVRDYAEAGLTRTFRLAAGALLETSFRLHRVERHYEYSYRLLGIVDVRGRVK
jgi:hypothetical protein